MKLSLIILFILFFLTILTKVQARGHFSSETNIKASLSDITIMAAPNCTIATQEPHSMCFFSTFLSICVPVTHLVEQDANTTAVREQQGAHILMMSVL